MTRAKVLVVADVVVVLTLLVTGLWQMLAWSEAAAEGGRGVHAVLLAASAVPLLFRRRHAVLVLVAVLVAAGIQYALGGGLGQPFFAVVLALYSIGAHAPAPQTFVGPAVIALQVVAIDAPRLVRGDPVDEVVPAWFVLTGVWGFGRWMRRRQVESAALAERADVAERDAADQAARAVTDERARIARELHDLVAHSLGVIVIQAQGGQRAMDTDPERARSALAAVESVGRGGLSEMRRLLNLLSDPPGGQERGGESAADTAPQPGLAQLRSLVERVRDAGLPVEVCVEGDVRALPAGLELSAYRLIQEALTNTLKHAGPATVGVRVAYRPDRLEIDVVDTGTGSNRTCSTGHGLVGMRERVSLYGGSLEVGNAPGGGFAVCARLPLTWELS